MYVLGIRKICEGMKKRREQERGVQVYSVLCVRSVRRERRKGMRERKRGEEEKETRGV
jgi:hypothetical protein